MNFDSIVPSSAPVCRADSVRSSRRSHSFVVDTIGGNVKSKRRSQSQEDWVIHDPVHVVNVLQNNTVRQEDSYRPAVTEDLLTRTSWVDARTAYQQVKKGRATGNECALWVRLHLQRRLYNLGCFIQKHCGKVLFVGLVVLALCCIALKTVTIETDVEKLWVEVGGRLEKESEYTRTHLGAGSGTTNEIVIQTPKSDRESVLSPDSMLQHYKALKAATKISVELYDVKWRFDDICHKTTFPSFDESFFDMMLEKLVPCIIITPLDCFWEGGKILGPDPGVSVPLMGIITWANLNPKNLTRIFRNYGYDNYVSGVEDLMDRAGVTSGYLEKPCLNPNDPQCPYTAPNKASKLPPDVGAELTGGCAGFASKFMKWEEDLILGGVYKNRSGYITRAAATQSIIQLMGEQDMYDYHQDTYKVSAIEWTPERAKEVLETWQRKFTYELEQMRNESNLEQDDIYPFASASLMDLLNEFSEVSQIRVILGYILMIGYACVSLLKWSDPIQSQAAVGLCGVLLVALSVAAGLGVCALLGINFNASTTQIIPFLALGLGVDDMFLIAHTFAENAGKPEIPHMEQAGECLKRTGVSVLLTSVSNMAAFFIAAIIPIPALRAFTMQAAILVIFNVGTILLIFPAVVSLDLLRREENRIDVLCCFTGSRNSQVPNQTALIHPVMHNTVTQVNPDGTHPITVLAQKDNPHISQENLTGSTASSKQQLASKEDLSCLEKCSKTQKEGCASFSLTWVAKHAYGPLLEKTSSKVAVFVAFIALLGFGIFGTVKVENGLDLTDIVPRDTSEFHFIDAQSKYFGFYNMYAVTQDDFDYASPKGQRLLMQYHQAFGRVDNIIKKEDGSLNDFWYLALKDWLLEMQDVFDKNLNAKRIHRNGWHPNATEAGIFAYKLMIQTGDLDSPVNEDRVFHGRLVDDDGIINEDAFYNYLTAWTSNDALAYASTQASFHPVPKAWYHTMDDHSRRIPKAQKLTFALIPFFLSGLGDTKAVTQTIEEIRGICDTFVMKGLPNYPMGIPFTFFEQYINLRYYLMLSLVCVLGGIFLVMSIWLMNPWAAFIVVAVLAAMVVELLGFMGLVGIKLSAIPAVILIVSVGIGVEFTVHVVMGFLTSIGSRNKRMVMSLEHMFAPVIHGAVSTLLGVIMLAAAEFDFIVKYFFFVLTALVVLGLLNGLVFLPVLLSVWGPYSEVIPVDGNDQLPPPEPSPPPPPRKIKTKSRKMKSLGRVPSNISLTTITEEPTQYSSHQSIVVEPEVVVETSLDGPDTPRFHRNNTSCNDSQSSSSNSPPPPPRRHTTTVKAKVKVEVHTPVPSSVDYMPSYKNKRRKARHLYDYYPDSGRASFA